MDAEHFDRLAQTRGARLTRRRGVGLLVALGLVGLGETPLTVAKNKKSKKKKKAVPCPNRRIRCRGHCCTVGQVCRRGQCRACNDDVDCGDAYFLALPICVAGRCEECVEDDVCATLRPQQPVCVDNVCRECRIDADCPDPDFPACNGGLCLECRQDEHCPAATPFCHGSGVCVDHCHNTTQDGDETDVDCGGPTCPKCVSGKQCDVDSDCQSGSCVDECVGCGDGSQCQ